MAARIAMAIVVTFVTTAASAGPITGKYADIVNRMRRLESAHTGVVSVFSIGTNDDGTDLMALRVSLTPRRADPKKVAHLIVGTHHGNETHAPLLTMMIADKLVARYRSHDLFEANLAETEWVIVPVLNVPGYNANSRYERNTDPNRDYPGPCISGPGGRLKSIRTIMEFMSSRVFSGGITVHGYLGALTYPWGVSAADLHTADHNFFAQATQKAAEHNGYRHGTSTDIVYPCDGSFEDYIYWKHGMWSLLVELESGSSSDLTRTTSAVMSFLDQVDSSPSVKHAFDTQCTREERLDLRIE